MVPPPREGRGGFPNGPWQPPTYLSQAPRRPSQQRSSPPPLLPGGTPLSLRRGPPRLAPGPATECRVLPAAVRSARGLPGAGCPTTLRQATPRGSEGREPRPRRQPRRRPRCFGLGRGHRRPVPPLPSSRCAGRSRHLLSCRGERSDWHGRPATGSRPP